MLVSISRYFKKKNGSSEEPSPYSDGDFVLLMRTTTADEEVAVPAQDVGVFDAIINWGDSSGDLVVDSYNSSNLTHTYSVAGDYTVVIHGAFPNVYYDWGSSAEKPISVIYGGTFENLDYGFSGCYNLTHIPSNMNVSSVTNFEYAWYECPLIEFPLLDTSNGTNFNGAWGYCDSLTEFPVLNVSSGTNFAEAWNGLSSLTEFPVLNVSNGESFSWAWAECDSLVEFPVLDLSNGTDFDSCWQQCYSLVSFSSVTFLNATNFKNAWAFCNDLEDFPPNLFDNLTGQMTNQCFENCWGWCPNLSAQSVENIFVSLNTASFTPPELTFYRKIHCDLKEGETLTPATVTAINSLKVKGWAPYINDVAQ